MTQQLHTAYAPVGYDYQADSYCLDCIPAVVAGTVGYRGDECNCAEHQLKRIAAVRGIDRMNEGSFDMSDFPKAVPYFNDIHADCGYADMDMTDGPHCGARCARCHEVIDGPCPALGSTQ